MKGSTLLIPFPCGMFHLSITTDRGINADILKSENNALVKKELCQKLPIISKKMSHIKLRVFIQKEY